VVKTCTILRSDQRQAWVLKRDPAAVLPREKPIRVQVEQVDAVACAVQSTR